MADMRKFWQSKKWLAFAVALVMSLLTYILNTKMGLGLDANAIFAMIGLSGLYLVAQGRIDCAKTGAAASKAFLDSHKAVALLLGNLVPFIVGFLNKRTGVDIPPDLVLGLLGVDAVYLIGKTAADMKNPDQH